MIAFSCRHCGEQMKVTEGDGGRRAVCLSCGRAVSIDGASRRVRSSASLALRGASSTAVHQAKAIHQLPTRFEPPTRRDEPMTSFLAPAVEADEIGRLGPYRVLTVVGAGGMGVVFRAHEPALDRIIALKAMLPALAAGGTARQRFVREARLAAAIQHDHVVTIFHVGEDRGVPYLSMPYLRGESLEARLTRVGRIPVEEALRIAQQIAEGLAAIHELGLIHRDIKPANVFLEGESSRVKILDFGLARATSDARLTQAGTIVGSPAYMAPEQAGRDAIDARADLFSLGCVLYQMLSGRLPFEREDALATLLAVRTEEPVALAGVPERVADLVRRMLAKEPAGRPETAGATLDLIKSIAEGSSC